LGATARPVTPPNFHLFGSGLGQPGSYRYFGAVAPCAPSTTYSAIAPTTASAETFIVFLIVE
jgi:hypothetical protein